jgi:hypothetical protein
VRWAPGVGAFARGRTMISCQPIESEIQFAHALHELGHCLSERCSGFPHDAQFTDDARRLDKMPLRELLKVVGNYDEAHHFGLPPSQGKTLDGWFSGAEAYWSRRRVEEWRRRLLDFAAQLERLK